MGINFFYKIIAGTSSESLPTKSLLPNLKVAKNLCDLTPSDEVGAWTPNLFQFVLTLSFAKEMIKQPHLTPEFKGVIALWAMHYLVKYSPPIQTAGAPYNFVNHSNPISNEFAYERMFQEKKFDRNLNIRLREIFFPKARLEPLSIAHEDALTWLGYTFPIFQYHNGPTLEADLAQFFKRVVSTWDPNSRKQMPIVIILPDSHGEGLVQQATNETFGTWHLSFSEAFVNQFEVVYTKIDEVLKQVEGENPDLAEALDQMYEAIHMGMISKLDTFKVVFIPSELAGFYEDPIVKTLTHVGAVVPRFLIQQSLVNNLGSDPATLFGTTKDKTETVSVGWTNYAIVEDPTRKNWQPIGSVTELIQQEAIKTLSRSETLLARMHTSMLHGLADLQLHTTFASHGAELLFNRSMNRVLYFASKFNEAKSFKEQYEAHELLFEEYFGLVHCSHSQVYPAGTLETMVQQAKTFASSPHLVPETAVFNSASQAFFSCLIQLCETVGLQRPLHVCIAEEVYFEINEELLKLGKYSPERMRVTVLKGRGFPQDLQWQSHVDVLIADSHYNLTKGIEIQKSEDISQLTADFLKAKTKNGDPLCSPRFTVMTDTTLSNFKGTELEQFLSRHGDLIQKGTMQLITFQNAGKFWQGGADKVNMGVAWSYGSTPLFTANTPESRVPSDSTPYQWMTLCFKSLNTFYAPYFLQTCANATTLYNALQEVYAKLPIQSENPTPDSKEIDKKSKPNPFLVERQDDHLPFVVLGWTCENTKLIRTKKIQQHLVDLSNQAGLSLTVREAFGFLHSSTTAPDELNRIRLYCGLDPSSDFSKLANVVEQVLEVCKNSPKYFWGF